MSLTARHHWCAERIQFCFASNDDDKENQNHSPDESKVQSFLRKPKNLSKFNDFFSGKGPAALFVHYQPRHTSELEALDQKVNGGGSSKQQQAAVKRSEFFLSSGDSVPMNSRCCYFLRQGDRIDSSIANDSSLLYGEILDSPLETIKSLLSSTYLPLFTESSEWGDTNDEQKADFNDEVNKFVHNLSVAVESISGGLELRELESSHLEPAVDPATAESQTLEEKAQQEAETITKLENLLDEWCGQVEKYMESRATTTSQQQLEGPKGEIEYWRSRRQQLSSIAEQLKRKDCKYVVNTLSTYTKGIKLHSKKSSTLALLRRWKQIETDTTEALNESENNSKYLSTLYRFIEPLYSGTAQGIIDTLPALLNSIKVRAFHPSPPSVF